MTLQETIDKIDLAHYILTSGANTYTATVSPSLKSYVTGKPFFAKFTNANTGPSTLSIDGLPAKNIYKSLAVPLVAGDIPANSLIEIVYDGTAFQVIGGAVLFVTVSQKINSAAANFVQTII